MTDISQIRDNQADLLHAARGVLKLELGAEGCSTNHNELADALALLRAAVAALDAQRSEPIPVRVWHPAR